LGVRQIHISYHWQVPFSQLYTTCEVSTKPYNFEFYNIIQYIYYSSLDYLFKILCGIYQPFHINFKIFKPSKLKTLTTLLVFVTFWTTTFIIYCQSFTFRIGYARSGIRR
jgi:hypothetical protein